MIRSRQNISTFLSSAAVYIYLYTYCSQVHWFIICLIKLTDHILDLKFITLKRMTVWHLTVTSTEKREVKLCLRCRTEEVLSHTDNTLSAKLWRRSKVWQNTEYWRLHSHVGGTVSHAESDWTSETSSYWKQEEKETVETKVLKWNSHQNATKKAFFVNVYESNLRIKALIWAKRHF